MKKLTIEQKAKAYDEAFEKSKEFYILCKKCGAKDTVDFLEDSFPELKESEDEKIRKSLIILLQHFCKGYRVPGLEFPVSYKDMLAWLEKQGEKSADEMIKALRTEYEKGRADAITEMQGEQKASVVDFKAKDWYVSKVDGKIHNIYYSGDKVEPKFKVGDWVIDKQNIVHQIANVIENVTYHTYGYDIVGGGYFNDNTEGVRLWTIQDTKDGDVIVYHNTATEIIMLFKSWVVDKETAYTHFHIFDNYFKVNGSCDCCNGAHPATKEQRDTLFAKMKEEGYEWDAEKKELKTVEKKPQRVVSAEAKEALYDKPTDNDMQEALRTEYEKGRADAFERAIESFCKVTCNDNPPRSTCTSLGTCKECDNFVKFMKG